MPSLSSPSMIKQATDDNNNDAEVVRIGYGPLPPQLPPVTGIGSASLKQQEESGGDDGDGELEKKRSDARRQSEGFVAFNKGFDDCDVTPEATNPVKRDTTTKTGKMNLSPMTPLKAIGGASVQILKIDDLRMFCSKNGIKGSRKAKKIDVCWAICKAHEAYLSGDMGPYKDLIPEGSTNNMEGGEDSEGVGGALLLDSATTNGGNGDEKDNTPIAEKSRKKRRVEDVSGLGTLLPSLPPATSIKFDKPSGGNSISEHMELQRRLVQSKEDTNRAIQLRETVESSAILRTGIREEKDRRVSLFKELVAKLGGDESQATSRINAYKEAKDNGTIMGEETYDPLIESVAEQDDLIAQMTLQHVTLNKEVDRLLPQEKNGEDTSEEIQDGSAVEPEEVLVKV